MNAIVPFQFDANTTIRTLTDSGEPWFSLPDVCKALDIANPSRVKAEVLDSDDVQVIDLYALRSTEGSEIKDLHNFVNESGLYQVIFQSRKPEAKRFKKWVTSEVLPAIRKTGSYTAPKAKPAKKDPTLPFIARETKAAIELAKAFGLSGNAALISASGAVVKMHQVNPMDLVGITHLDNVEQALYSTPTELGERLGITGAQMNKRLESAGLQTRQGERWVPTEEGMKHCRIQDTTKRHKSGAMVQQVKWDDSVVDRVSEAKIAA